VSGGHYRWVRRPLRTVAALYVDPEGNYPSMPGVECWDEQRDARTYPGPHPVIVHPPCGRWCKLAKFVERTHGYKVGDDGGLFEHALATVRRYGGVLEHPAWSLAWSRYGLATPPETGWGQTAAGEWVCEVAQSAYGHDARKLTWLLLVGGTPQPTIWDKPKGARVVAYMTQRHTGDFQKGAGHGARMRNSHVTPLAFNEFLVRLARSVGAR
jgi:hypothetical protein